MASDEIINEIWEVAQENSIDSIDKGEFGKDLRKAVFAELEKATDGVISDINNEFARALPIILHQAKANPDLIYENNGKGFSVASGIFTKAVLTVKYENRYIPGTAEYQKEFPKESLTEVVLTGAIADAMINNFDNLSNDERRLLNNNWKKLTSDQRKNIMKKTRKMIQDRDDLTDDEKRELDDAYGEATALEDSDDEFEKMTPEDKAKYSTLFLDRLCKDSPEMAEQIKKLRGIGLSDVEIRQIVIDDNRTLSQQVNDFFINFTEDPNSPESKDALLIAARNLYNDTKKIREASEYTDSKMGVKKIQVNKRDETKKVTVNATTEYVENILERDYAETRRILFFSENTLENDPRKVPIPEYDNSRVNSIRN